MRRGEAIRINRKQELVRIWEMCTLYPEEQAFDSHHDYLKLFRSWETMEVTDLLSVAQ